MYWHAYDYLKQFTSGDSNAHDSSIDAQRQASALDLVKRLAADPGVKPADVFINIIEVASENWSAGNGLAGRNPTAAAAA
jgi:hypothetical protein